ncbi:MAG: hypothetical protein AB7V62_01165 [Thermoleophilia bacterium]
MTTPLDRLRARMPAETVLPSGARVAWPRAVAAALIGAVLTALLLGVPTDVIPNPWFGRMTPVEAYAVPVLVATSLLSGILCATWFGVEAASCPTRGTGTGGAVGGAFAWLAIGCPVCNKLVLLALGTSGALTWFAPLQPWLAAGSLVVLGATLAWRLRVLMAPPGAATPA